MEVLEDRKFTKDTEGQEAKNLARTIVAECTGFDGSAHLLTVGAQGAPALLLHMTMDGREYVLGLWPTDLAT